jgi:hypothetical protein
MMFLDEQNQPVAENPTKPVNSDGYCLMCGVKGEIRPGELIKFDCEVCGVHSTILH